MSNNPVAAYFDTCANRSLNQWADAIHEWARRKKWWKVADDGSTVTDRSPLELLMLINTELCEAAEVARMPNFQPLLTWGSGEQSLKPEGFGIELADALIRILDTARAYGLDMEKLVSLKMMYNETRPDRHGGKLA